MKYEKEYAFLGIVGDVLNGKDVRPLPEGVTADDIFAIGSRQDMAPITFCALNSIKNLEKGSSWLEHQKRFLSDCTRSEVQLGEYDKLIPYLCEHGVKVLPLKGCVIKRLYPTPSLRTMSDIDLLYEGVTPQELAELMEKVGYSTENLESGCHDVFHKKPCMNIEPHRKLVVDDSPYRSVLQDMFAKAVPDEKISNLYHMKPEDLYIHVIVHAAKHFVRSGLGVRPMGDIYVLNQKFGADWDREYIDRQLVSVKLEKFEKRIRDLAYAFFGKEEVAVSDEDMEVFFQGSTYGNYSDVGRKYMSKGGKSRIAFFLHRTFYPYSGMCEMFPVLKKWPVLLPFAWVYRIIDVLLHRRGNVVRIASADISKNGSEQVSKTMQNFGLD